METLRPSIVFICAVQRTLVEPLARARALDQADDERGCMSAVNEAKGQIGARLGRLAISRQCNRDVSGAPLLPDLSRGQAVAWAMSKGYFHLGEMTAAMIRLYCSECHRFAQFRRAALLERS